MEAGEVAARRADAPANLQFARTARRLGAAARAAGLIVPAFRCPPRVAGATRTIRRYANTAVVSVRLRHRPFDAVAADMIEGVIAVNRLEGDAARCTRDALRAELDPPEVATAAA